MVKQMNKNWKDVVLGPQATVLEAMKVLDKFGTQVVIVADDNYTLLGIITDGDIRRGLLHGAGTGDSVVKVMNSNPITADENVSAKEVLSILQERNILHMAVKSKDGKIVGLYTLRDFFTKHEFENPVVLMAGGLGSRLGQLTENCPKPLIKVGDKPILETIITGFKDSGFKNINLAVNYKSEMIEAYFQDGKKLGVKIDYIRESKRMGTAGALSLMSRPALPVVVMNGDLLVNINYSSLIDFHNKHQFDLTVGVRKYDLQIPFGVIEAEGHRVVGLEEKPKKSFLVNGGIYVVNPSVVERIPKDQFFDMTTLIEDCIQNKLKVGAFLIHENWIDIGRVEDLEKAKDVYKEIFD